jgi:hypothetical protein
MSNGHGIDTPANRIATALAGVALALRLSAEVEEGRLTEEIYRRAVTIHTGGPGVRLPPDPSATIDDLRNGMHNVVLIAVGASALLLDETLDECFGPVAKDADPTRTGLRALASHLRNAFAHNPTRPRWTIRERYRHRYEFELGAGDRIVFDATTLDGKQIQPADFGGFEVWVRVLQHCERLVPN